MSTCVTIGWCSTAISARTPEHSYTVCGDQRGSVPGAAGLCGRHVRPQSNGNELGREARNREAMKRTNAVIAGILVGMLGMRLWPHASLAQRVPLSTAVWSADRELLRVTLASDDQYRLWTPLSQMSPALVEAFLLKEDRLVSIARSHG